MVPYLRQLNGAGIQRRHANGPSTVGGIAHRAEQHRPQRPKHIGRRPERWLLQRQIVDLDVSCYARALAGSSHGKARISTGTRGGPTACPEPEPEPERKRKERRESSVVEELLWQCEEGNMGRHGGNLNGREI